MIYRINFVRLFLIIVSLSISFLTLSYFTHTAKAAPTTYWFNNAVDTDPATLGNYWLDDSQIVPAVELPDLNEDVVNVVSGATYAGNLILRGNAFNEGIIHGNATFYDFSYNNGAISGNGIFYEDGVENFGTVQGTRTRIYASETYVERDFVSDGPWTIVADGAEITIEASQFNASTIFQRYNGGYFISFNTPESTSIAFNNTVKLFYFYYGLNTNFIPDASDFSVTVNGDNITVTNINISSPTVLILTLDSSVSIASGDTILVSYNLGLVPLISGFNPTLHVDPLSNMSVETLTSLLDAPVYGSVVGTKLYISNNHNASISIIDTTTNTLLDVIPVESYPEFNVLVGKKIYVNNLHSNSVSVIDTTTDTVVATIPVVAGPYFSTVVGSKIYISGTNTNQVSVINTLTDSVVATITVGTAPWYGSVVGTKLYIPNRNSNSVSVIDTTTDTVSATISTTVNTAGTRAVVVGTKVFVGGNTTVGVINSLTDTVSTNINVGSNPYFSCVYGSKVYVPNRGSSSLSVINATTNSVITTLSVGAQPTTCVVIGSRIYVTKDGNSNNTIAVIDGTSDTIVESITVGQKPFYATAVGDRLFTSNNFSNDFSIINTTAITSLLPNLISFTTPSADGVYNEGDSIEIRANFGQSLQAGSTMTVQLNSGASVVLNSVSASSLYGHYVVGMGESSPDLAVTSIINASVTSISGQTRTSYTVPTYQPSNPNLVAENSFITRNLGDSSNIVVGSYLGIPVGNNPYQVTSPITVDGVQYSYIANQGSATVSVLRLSDQAIVATIPVGLEAYGVTSVTLSGTTYVYVANTGSDTVSVINTSTNAVVATVSVGVKPYYVAAVGDQVYVTNGQSNTVSVINAITNIVTDTIPVGVYPRGIKAYGTDVYVANYGDPNYSGGNSVSVIDSTTNTVTDTIVMPAGVDGPRGVNILGSNVYIANFRSHNVSIIDTATNTVTTTVNVGQGPRGIVGLGTKVYIENFDDGTISVLDTNTNTVTDTLIVGHSPAGIMVAGNELYLTRFQDNTISILSSLTNELRPAAPIISNINSVIIGPSSSHISWTTDTQATSLLEYGLTTSYDNSTSLGTLSTSPFLLLQNLVSGRTYYFRITSTDAYGTVARSSDNIFTTFGGGGGISINNASPPVSDPEPLDNLEGDVLHQQNEHKESIIDKPLQLIKNVLCQEWPRLLPTSILHQELYNQVVGEFLLATEDKGRLWYVDPKTRYRYEVSESTALCLFESVSLGITQKNLDRISIIDTASAPTRLGQNLQGRFLLNVENQGQTWYVDKKGLRYKIGISNLVSLASKLALGISNSYLSLLPIGGSR